MKLFRCFSRTKNQKVEDIAANDILVSEKHDEQQPECAPEDHDDDVGTGRVYDDTSTQHRDSRRGGMENIEQGRRATGGGDGGGGGRDAYHKEANSNHHGAGKTHEEYSTANSYSTTKQSKVSPTKSPIGHREGRPDDPPPAREAAFQGPPRFDWIDIETAAATKIQAAYRRNLVMNQLEENHMSTSAIRNRRRHRKARSAYQRVAQSEDVPSLFSCCAIGLAFGDATEDGDDAYRQFQKSQYEERLRQQTMHEDALRKRYMKENNLGTTMLERFEVVDNE